MGRCRVVLPESVTLPLSDGDWIAVKKRLNVGEARDARAAVYGDVLPDGTRRPNVAMAGLAQIVAYIVDWNLSGPDGKTINIDTAPRKLAAIRSLDEDTFREIDAAVAAHMAAVEEADADAKKTKEPEAVS